LILGGLGAGDVLVAVDGFPTAFAPADGVNSRCVTVPANEGAMCDAGQTALPSFLAAPNAVTVVPGERASAGDIAIASVPFLADLVPGDGATVAQARVDIRFAVVSANGQIDPASIDVRAAAGVPAQTFGATLQPPQPCDERVANPTTRCTAGADIDVAGFLVDATTDPLPAGPATITIEAEDRANPPRRMQFTYGITVAPGATTTTSTTTTSTTSVSVSSTTSTSIPVLSTTTLPPTTTTTQVTTTTTSTTTTTLAPPFVCTLTFSVANSQVLESLAYDTDYTAASGRFERLSEGSRCSTIRPEAPVVTFDDEANRVLTTTINSPVSGFANPGDIALCKFYTADPTLVAIDDFVITITGATLPGGGTADPVVVLSNLDCGGSGTTTTTTLPLPPQACDITFGFTTSVLVSQLSFNADYTATGGLLEGNGTAVQCTGLAGDSQSFVDDDATSILAASIFAANGIPGPADVGRCRYSGPTPPGFEQGFAITTVQALDPNGTPTGATVGVTNVICGVP
jgi:hypothetical protein